MKKHTIKNITFRRLIQIFLVAIILILIVMFLAYRQFFAYTTENKVLEIANLVKSSLTSHMKAGIMDKREYFLQEMKQVENIQKIQIIRSPAIDKQFGKSTLKEEITQTKISPNPLYIWNDIDGYMQATIPYVASSKEDLNCLQ